VGLGNPFAKEIRFKEKALMPKLHTGDINVHYEITGEGEPLLFIHGLGSSKQVWQMQVPVFSAYYRVITFDLRGHGRSDKPLGLYNISMFAADTAEFMKSIGIPSAHVVGFSLGGMVGLQLCLDAPEMVRSLVVVNSPVTGYRQSFREGFESWKHFTRVQLTGIIKERRPNGQQLFSKQAEDQWDQTLTERFAITNMLAQANSFWAILKESLTDSLSLINCPTLVVASDEDYVPLSVKSAYVSRIPRAEMVVIPNSRHAVPIEQSERFNTVLLDFLSKHSSVGIASI
jgi:3-oxoadipate enol-lactonase